MKISTAILVGPRSTEDLTYGMSIGFDMLISGFEERKLPHFVVDRSQGMAGRRVGTFTSGGMIATSAMLCTFIKNLHRVDVIYPTIGLSKAGFIRDLLMIWLSWPFRKPIVLHLKGGGLLEFYQSGSFLLKTVIASTFARADAIIVLGKLLRDQFQFVPNIDSKSNIVSNGLPGGLQKYCEIHRLRDESQPFHLLYLSNMIPPKGYLHVLEACHILHTEREIPIHCDFCGAFVATANDNAKVSPAEAEAAFRRLIDAKGLEGSVHYHGTVRGDHKRAILHDAHVFILPTSYSWEGQPISIIGALACGLPVISIRFRGIPEQVIHGWNGFLLEERSPRAIADAVETLWRDQALHKEFSRNAIEQYRKNFTLEAHLNRLIPVILGREIDSSSGE